MSTCIRFLVVWIPERIRAGAARRRPIGAGECRNASYKDESRPAQNGAMDESTDFNPGDKLGPKHSHRTMTVRRIEGQPVACSWFDGKTMHEARLMPDAPRLESAA